MLQNCASIAKRVYHSLYFPLTVVFVTIMAVTVWTWASARQSLNNDIQNAIESRVDATDEALAGRLTTYEQMLRGGVGFLQGSNEVTKNEWRDYFAAYQLDSNKTDVEGIGYARITPAGEVDELVQNMHAQGVANFKVFPRDPRQEVYAPLLYVQPERLSSAKAIGFDLMSDAARSMAVQQAQATGDTALSGKLQLLSSSPNPTGFIMYLPYFAPGLPIETLQQRSQAIRGYVLAAFRSKSFFKEIVPDTDNAFMAVKIQSSTASQDTLYQSANYAKLAKDASARQTIRTFQAYGQEWHMRYQFIPHALVSSTQLSGPASILGAGFFTALLLVTIVWLLLRKRAHKLTRQKDQDIEFAKDELLSLASHQLRTPATGVKQYLGMVLQGFAGDIPPQQKSLLQKAYASNDRQLGVINEILHLAKINSGRIILARQPNDLTELVHDVITEQKPDLLAARHQLKTDIPKTPVRVTVDAHMLRMAIENLLSNAIKYTPAGGTITVTMRTSKTRVYIAVRDTGVGIEPAHYGQLFKQFSRLPNELSAQAGGTGVGLYLAKHLVELHGGRIRFESAAGKGSEFSISLPLNS